MSELAASRVLGTTWPPPPPAPPSPTPLPGSAALAALRSIVDYIPTEIVTIYVAVGAALSDGGTPSRTGQWVAFWVFLGVTPLALGALFAARLRAAGSSPPLDPMRWPWPELTVATVAYVLWAFTLPGTPFADFSWYKPGLGAAVLLVGTLVLGLGAPLFTRTPAPARP
jgi:hypothetical protein